MHVLGTTNSPDAPLLFNPSHLHVTTNAFSKKQIPHIFCPPEANLSVQVVMFQRPHPTRMEYMSLDPISLALGDKVSPTENSALSKRTRLEDEEGDRGNSQIVIEKLKLHTVVKHMPSQKEQALPLIINQVNCAYEIGQLMHKNSHLIGVRAKRSMSVGERVVESATTLWGLIVVAIAHVFWQWIWPIVTRVFVIGLVGHRSVAEIVLQILEWRARPDAAAIKDISATAQQVDIRLQQFCYWPIQYVKLRSRKDNWESVTNSHPDYIRFYNSLWLVANDVIIGIALGSYIIDNANWVASQISTVLTGWTVEGLQRTISWLMDWPGGLKLNNELAAFLGDLFLWVIENWAGFVANLQPYLPHVIYIIGCSSFAGASMPIALFSDLLSMLTIHIYSFYIASARIFNWQLTIIHSLFHLFRGKKRNVLRNRIDSCDYDLDQLLLGTILFTVLFFLLPTVVVFYLTFASARMLIISLKAALDTCLAFLNHFPLFALMLRVKDSSRLPGGIRFELREEANKKSTDVAIPYIHMEVCSDIPLQKKFPNFTDTNVYSLFLSRFERCSINTSSWAIDCASITLHPMLSSALSQAASCRLSIDVTCTACNIACFPLTERACPMFGRFSPSQRKSVAEAAAVVRWEAALQVPSGTQSLEFLLISARETSGVEGIDEYPFFLDDILVYIDLIISLFQGLLNQMIRNDNVAGLASRGLSYIVVVLVVTVLLRTFPRSYLMPSPLLD